MTTKEKNLYTFSSLQYFPDVLQLIKKEQLKKKEIAPTRSKNVSRVKENQTDQELSILEQIKQAEQSSTKKINKYAHMHIKRPNIKKDKLLKST